LARLGLWALVLVPIVGCIALTVTHAVNQRFLDDWVWAQDLIKWKTGQPILHDLFEVHLEHRPAVARALTLFSTALAGGDVQAQNVLTLVWLMTAFGSVCLLWTRFGGLTIRQAWLPLAPAAAVLFSPIQWQTLLWPICHGTAMPLFFLALSLVAAFARWPWGVRCALGTLCGVLGMLSFASGFLVWVLPLPVFLFCGRFKNHMQRFAFVVAWCAVFAVALALYLQVKIQPHSAVIGEKVLLSLGSHDVTYDLRNEVPPQFAYGVGEENTMDHGFSFLKDNLPLCIQFMATFTGAFLTHGWSADYKTTAGTVGWILIALLLAATVYFWRHRKDEALRRALLPMLCLGAYTPLTGFMVATGRAFAGGTGTALNGRYTVHQTALIVALIGAAVFIGRHWLRNRAPLQMQGGGFVRLAGWICAGLLGGVVGLGWLHGASMMREWQAGRFRGRAAQYLSQVFNKYNHFVGFVAGNQTIAVEGAKALNDLGLLKGGLATSRKLSQFRMAGTKTLDESHGSFIRLGKIADGSWIVQGYTFLPGSLRPADAILLAYQNAEGEWIMFGMTQAYGVPYFLSRSMGKDMYAIIPGRDPWPSSMMCPWDREVYIHEEPPPGAKITAWAYDANFRQIHRVCHFHDEIIKDKHQDLPDDDGGSTLEELSREEQ
jgi:hypothetical protein